MNAKQRGLALPLLLGIAVGVTSGPALAADAAATLHMVRTVCQNCHGEDGIATLPGAANLSGQQKEYLVQQLRAYRSGRRQDPQMNVVTKTLTDADIENLAEWYSKIKITVEKPR